VERCELAELHYIAPIVNVQSILQHGILSHDLAKGVPHQSVAMNEIQDRRAEITVPGGRPLHEYANLYVCARNPMMFKRRDGYRGLCILRVDPAVLDVPGAVVTDGNASGIYVRFSAAPRGLAIVQGDWTFAEFWTDTDQITGWKKKAAKCAEVLVPDRVDPNYITGAYVACLEALDALQAQEAGISVVVNSNLFFR
jgi:hypothetical protein